MKDKAPESTQQVLRQCVQHLRAVLPAGWDLTERDGVRLGLKQADAVLALTDPAGTTAELVVEAKRVVERRDLGRLKERLDEEIAQSGGRAKGLAAARYLPPRVRAELEELDLAYIDTTGNIRLAIERPAIFISAQVTDRDPWRPPGRPRGSLKGEPAARVVRTLLDYVGPLFISDILKLSGASTGPTYRVRDYLLEEGLLERIGGNGAYRVPDWQKLLREWAADYVTLEVNTTRTFIEPRGIDTLRGKATNIAAFNYAVTGSVAAEEWAPYAPAKSALIYVDNIDQAAEWLGLRATDTGQNVILIEPKSPESIVFANTQISRYGVILASPSQVAVDLLNGPGRNPSEAEALIAWMADNEGAWRK